MSEEWNFHENEGPMDLEGLEPEFAVECDESIVCLVFEEKDARLIAESPTCSNPSARWPTHGPRSATTWRTPPTSRRERRSRRPKAAETKEGNTHHEPDLIPDPDV